MVNLKLRFIAVTVTFATVKTFCYLKTYVFIKKKCVNLFEHVTISLLPQDFNSFIF